MWRARQQPFRFIAISEPRGVVVLAKAVPGQVVHTVHRDVVELTVVDHGELTARGRDPVLRRAALSTQRCGPPRSHTVTQSHSHTVTHSPSVRGVYLYYAEGISCSGGPAPASKSPDTYCTVPHTVLHPATTTVLTGVELGGDGAGTAAEPGERPRLRVVVPARVGNGHARGGVHGELR
eukprot:52248-Pyramimonas_sp.AAC.1